MAAFPPRAPGSYILTRDAITGLFCQKVLKDLDIRHLGKLKDTITLSSALHCSDLLILMFSSKEVPHSRLPLLLDIFVISQMVFMVH